MYDRHAQKRSWVITAAWFGTILLIGALKRIMDRQQSSSPRW
jgi:hypothetical protein